MTDVFQSSFITKQVQNVTLFFSFLLGPSDLVCCMVCTGLTRLIVKPEVPKRQVYGRIDKKYYIYIYIYKYINVSICVYGFSC